MDSQQKYGYEITKPILIFHISKIQHVFDQSKEEGNDQESSTTPDPGHITMPVKEAPRIEIKLSITILDLNPFAPFTYM